MMNQQIAQTLHDKATRGGALSAQEETELRAWYAQQDADEMRLFGLSSDQTSISKLQGQTGGEYESCLD